jgi:hypothetical protein
MTQRWGSKPAARPGATPGRPSGRRLRAAFAALLAAVLGLLLSVVLAGPAAAASGHGQVYVVHGIVGQVLDIYVDGKQVLGSADPKSIVGPLKLASGSHRVQLRKGDQTVAQGRFGLESGQSVDVVAHLKSDSAMGATVTAYRNDLSAVGPGKLRLAVAHTAAAPPADIRVNGDVLFSNVANGETLTVVVPAGTYKVDIVPAATDGKAILGPVDLSLKKGTLTRVFAIGNVTTGSMDAVVHSLKVKTSGSAAPSSVPTGDGGQAAREFITGASGTTEVLMASALGLLATAGLIAFGGRRMRRRISL